MAAPLAPSSPRTQPMNAMSTPIDLQRRQAHRLLQWGFALFLAGLLTGFAIPAVANPRMGLTSHIEGVMNGMFLAILGLIWMRLRLGRKSLRIGFGLVVYGAVANWATTLLAAILGAGGLRMPIAAGDHVGSPFQEALISAGLISLSVAMLGAVGLVLWGLRAERGSIPSTNGSAVVTAAGPLSAQPSQ
jgi:(hydroxyamino)benzene mutase